LVAVLDPAVAAVLDSHARLASACGRPPGARVASARVLSRRQAAILAHLDRGVPLPIGDLARRLRVSAATTSLAVDRLVRLRCVRRTRDVADRRRVLLRLTALGASLRAAFSELDPARVRTLLDRLGPTERASTVSACRLLARVAAMPIPTPHSQDAE
jgi:DNA-binding MarR family transcriptional regulator